MKIKDNSIIPHTYEVVQEPPLGYCIWNIGKHNAPEGYLPFCRLSSNQPFPGGRAIEIDTLKALKCDGWDVILDAVGFGPETSREMQEFLRKNQNKQYLDWICKRMRKAFPYLQSIGM